MRSCTNLGTFAHVLNVGDGGDEYMLYARRALIICIGIPRFRSLTGSYLLPSPHGLWLDQGWRLHDNLVQVGMRPGAPTDSP